MGPTVGTPRLHRGVLVGFAEAGRNWLRKRELKRELLAQLKRLRPGQGIDVPKTDPVAAAAVQELIDAYPNWITVVRFGEAFQLITKPGVKGVLSKETHEQLEARGFFGQAGEDLAAEAIAAAEEAEKKSQSGE